MLVPVRDQGRGQKSWDQLLIAKIASQFQTADFVDVGGLFLLHQWTKTNWELPFKLGGIFPSSDVPSWALSASISTVYGPQTP